MRSARVNWRYSATGPWPASKQTIDAAGMSGAGFPFSSEEHWHDYRTQMPFSWMTHLMGGATWTYKKSICTLLMPTCTVLDAATMTPLMFYALDVRRLAQQRPSEAPLRPYHGPISLSMKEFLPLL